MSIKTPLLLISRSEIDEAQKNCTQAVVLEVSNILHTKDSTNPKFYVEDNMVDVDVIEVSPLLHEIADCIENNKTCVPNSREAKAIQKFTKKGIRVWQPYTSFGYSILDTYKSLTGLKLAWITLRLSEESSRFLYSSNSPARAFNKKLKYHFKKSIDGTAKGMFVIERSTNRPLFNIISHSQEIIKMDYQLHVHMLILGTEDELDKLCGKHKGYKGLKNFCSKENNAILCEYSYSKKIRTKIDDTTRTTKQRVPVDRGAADYMAKEFDNPIVSGARNFSFFGIESEVLDRWNKTVSLQKRLIKLCTDVINQLKFDVNPDVVLYQTIRTLLK